MAAPLAGTLPPVPRVLRAWYVLCTSAELVAGARPLRRSLYGTPVALWRAADGTPGAVLDRCPHRDVPLTFGAVKGGYVQCGYHGWEFDPRGHCRRVPGLLGEADRPARRVAAYALVEQQGFVWAWADPSTEPVGQPYRFPWADDPRHLTVRYTLRAQASLHAVAENALDVPHTAFLHRGLFRDDASPRNRIRCVVRRTDTLVECEYIGEPRPSGIAARILAPSGGVVTHFDRFHMPCVVEVEYALGEDSHIVNAAALTPAEDHETVLYAVISVRTRLPAALVRPLVQPIGLRIFNQDAELLALQTESMRRFGSAKYVSTELDLLGPHILRLLHRAAGGAAEPAEPYQAEVELEV